MGAKKGGMGYITDGLVLHLDGIDKGTTDTTKWVDLVGGKVFNLYNCTIGNNYVQFNGSTSYGLYSGTWSCPDTTIEVIASSLSSSIGFAYAERSGMFGALTSSYFYFRYATGVNNGAVAKAGLCNSANSSAAVINGVDWTTALMPSNYGGNSSAGVVCLGKRDTTSPNFFYGKIYAIREYNRKLTVDEMIANQKIDNERFNLGLTI